MSKKTAKPEGTKRYGVYVPIAGVAYIEVDAVDAEAAEELALSSVEQKHLQEWEAHRQLVQGNVIHFQHNRIDVEEIEE